MKTLWYKLLFYIYTSLKIKLINTGKRSPFEKKAYVWVVNRLIVKHNISSGTEFFRLENWKTHKTIATRKVKWWKDGKVWWR